MIVSPFSWGLHICPNYSYTSSTVTIGETFFSTFGTNL